jgi:hypothetical protein
MSYSNTGSLSRLKRCEGISFSDPQTGILYDGLRYITLPNGSSVEGVDVIEVWYKDGKLHREEGHAVAFPDGHKEEWKNGKFIRICETAFKYR